MAFTYVTVTADYDLGDGTDPSGTVTFTPTAPMVNSGVINVAAPVTRRVDVDGHLTVSLAANTDPGTAPSGTAYLVLEQLNGVTRSYYVTIPHDQGSTVDLSGLASAGVAPAISFPAKVIVEAPLSLTDPRVNCALDGTGDESAKVATAISLLPAAGGHIYHPPGILRTGAINFDRPVYWQGAGTQASTIKAASGFTGTQLTVTSSAPFSHVSQVAIDGNGVATNLLKVASARTLISHVYLSGQDGSTGAALWFNGTASNASAHAAQVSNVRILSCDGYGVFLQGFAYDNEFVNLWVGSCNVGIRAQDASGFFTNTHVWGCTSNGVELRAANHLFSNCYIETNGGSGFNLFNSSNVRISNSTIWKNAAHGISVDTADRLSVIGCHIYDQGSNGVNGNNSLYGQIVGNTFYDVTSSGQSQDRPVVTAGTSDKWIVTNNVMLTSEHAVGASSLVGANNILADNITS